MSFFINFFVFTAVHGFAWFLLFLFAQNKYERTPFYFYLALLLAGHSLMVFFISPLYTLLDISETLRSLMAGWAMVMFVTGLHYSFTDKCKEQVWLKLNGWFFLTSSFCYFGLGLALAMWEDGACLPGFGLAVNAGGSLLALCIVIVWGVKYNRKQNYNTNSRIILISVLLLIIENGLQSTVLWGKEILNWYRGNFLVTAVCEGIWFYMIVLHYHRITEELALQKVGVQLGISLKNIEMEQALEARDRIWQNNGHELVNIMNLWMQRFRDRNILKSPLAGLEQLEIQLKALSAQVLQLTAQQTLPYGSSAKQVRWMDISRMCRQVIEVYRPVALEFGIATEVIVEDRISLRADAKILDSLLHSLVWGIFHISLANGHIEIYLNRIDDTACLHIVSKGNRIRQALWVERHPLVAAKYSNPADLNGSAFSEIRKQVSALNGKIQWDRCSQSGFCVKVLLPACLVEPDFWKNLPKPVPAGLAAESLDCIGNDRLPNLFLIGANRDRFLYLRDRLKSDYNLCFSLNGFEALNRLPHMPLPDVVVCESELEGMDGLQVIQHLASSKHYNHLPIIFVGSSMNDMQKKEAFRIGAVDCIDQTFTPEQLEMKIAAILSLMQRRKAKVMDSAIRFISGEMTEEPILTCPVQSLFEKNCVKYNLTIREKEIVEQLKINLTHQEIAQRLHISERTVGKHIQNVYRKVQVKKKDELLETVYN